MVGKGRSRMVFAIGYLLVGLASLAEMSSAIPWAPRAVYQALSLSPELLGALVSHPYLPTPTLPQWSAMTLSYQVCLMSTVCRLRILLLGVFLLLAAEWQGQRYKPFLLVCRMVISDEHWGTKQPSGNGRLVPVEQSTRKTTEISTLVVRFHIWCRDNHLHPVTLCSHGLCNNRQPVMYLKRSRGFIYSVSAAWAHHF